MISRKVWLIISLALCGSGLSPLWAETGPAQDAAFKAVFIYHFTQYVKWPETDTSSVFSIGVLGDTEVAAPLGKVVREKQRVGDRKLVIHPCDVSGDLDAYQILLISESVKGQLDGILEKIGDKPVLTVGAGEGFVRCGVGIDFTHVRGVLKFEVNRQAIERAGLKISSQLLKLGILVDEESRGK